MSFSRHARTLLVDKGGESYKNVATSENGVLIQRRILTLLETLAVQLRYFIARYLLPDTTPVHQLQKDAKGTMEEVLRFLFGAK